MGNRRVAQLVLMKQMKPRSRYSDSLFGLSGNGVCTSVSACEHASGFCSVWRKKKQIDFLSCVILKSL